MEVINMTRLIKMLSLAGLSSVYLMQLQCTTLEHGFSIFSGGLIPNPFAGLFSSVTGLFT
jgi:hypothetical protein